MESHKLQIALTQTLKKPSHFQRFIPKRLTLNAAFEEFSAFTAVHVIVAIVLVFTANEEAFSAAQMGSVADPYGEYA